MLVSAHPITHPPDCLCKDTPTLLPLLKGALEALSAEVRGIPWPVGTVRHLPVPLSLPSQSPSRTASLSMLASLEKSAPPPGESPRAFPWVSLLLHSSTATVRGSTPQVYVRFSVCVKSPDPAVSIPRAPQSPRWPSATRRARPIYSLTSGSPIAWRHSRTRSMASVHASLT